MTSQLNVDTIVDKAGSGGTNVKVKGSDSTYVDGTSTQNLVSGLCKMCADIDGDASTVVARDSLNVSSVSDNSTGRYTPTLTNNMGSSNYLNLVGNSQNTSSSEVSFVDTTGTTTGSVYLNRETGGTFRDPNQAQAAYWGDLA